MKVHLFGATSLTGHASYGLKYMENQEKEWNLWSKQRILSKELEKFVKVVAFTYTSQTIA